mmetsp:Transcript_39381/g.116765  ORF Transcript_39381/g.116765 Transcript_39381/m.116765 type:complete len:715 (+) Transcript_39381:71-2215(+)
MAEESSASSHGSLDPSSLVVGPLERLRRVGLLLAVAVGALVLLEEQVLCLLWPVVLQQHEALTPGLKQGRVAHGLGVDLLREGDVLHLRLQHAAGVVQDLLRRLGLLRLLGGLLGLALLLLGLLLVGLRRGFLRGRRRSGGRGLLVHLHHLAGEVAGGHGLGRRGAHDGRAWRGGHRHAVGPRGEGGGDGVAHRGLVIHVHIRGSLLQLALRGLLLAQGLGLGGRGQHRGRGLRLLLLLRGLQGLRVGEERRAGPALQGEVLRDLQLLRQADKRVRGEREGEHVDQREPVPHLREEHETDGRATAKDARLGVERGAGVAASRIHHAVGEDGAEASHDVFVLVADDLLQLVAELLHALRLARRGLHVEQAHGDDGALPHEVGGVGHQRLQEVVRLELRGAGAGDAERHGRRVAHMRVVALGEELHHAWQLVGHVAQHEAERHHGGAADVVRDIRDGDVQQAADRRVLGGAHIREGDAEAGAVAEDGVLVQEHLLDEPLGLLLPAEHDHGQRQRAGTDDLLVLRVVGVGQQLLDRLLRAGADHDQADGVGRRLARHRRVGVEGLLQLLVRVLVRRGHAHEADAEAGPVLQDLRGLGVVELLEQVGLGVRAVVVRVDDSHGVQSTAFGVGAPTRSPRLGQVGAEDGLGLLDVALVNDAQRGRRAEFRPVGRLGKPLQVLPQEDVAGGAALHQAVGNHRAVVRDGVLGVYRILYDLQQ